MFNQYSILRFLALGGGMSLFIFSVSVLVRYRKVLSRRGHDNKVPIHIYSVMTSYIILIGYICFIIIEKIFDHVPISGSIFAALMGFGLGIVSLWFMNSALNDEINRRF